MICYREFRFHYPSLKSTEFCYNRQINYWWVTLIMWGLVLCFIKYILVLLLILVHFLRCRLFFPKSWPFWSFSGKLKLLTKPFWSVRFKLLFLLYWAAAEISAHLFLFSSCYFPPGLLEFYLTCAHIRCQPRIEGKFVHRFVFFLSPWLLHLGSIPLNFQAFWQPQTNPSGQ